MRNRRNPTKSIKSFRPKKFEDFEIVNAENHTIGHIRIQPSGIKWAAADGKMWFGIGLTKFKQLMEHHGKKKQK